MPAEIYGTAEDMKTLPLTNSSYVRAFSENQYVVDKTLLIKAIIDRNPLLTVFTRPRGFGKSFNMSMLRAFFEKTDEDASVCFRDKKIWSSGEKYTSEQGKYPVIYLDFKDVIGNNWDEAFEGFKDCISDAYLSHKELLSSSRVEKMLDLPYYKSIVYDTAEPSRYGDSLLALTRMLTDHYGVPPVVIIDGFDTPVQAGYDSGYYDDIMEFMDSFLSAALKGNDGNIRHAFLCGVLPVSFSGMNNVFPNTVLNGLYYSEFFGFTPEETRILLDYYGLGDRYPEVCEQYAGYRAGDAVLFNPLDILMYIDSEGHAGDYWVNTSANLHVPDAIRNTLEDADSYDASMLMDLIEGKSLTGHVDASIFYDEEEPALNTTVLVHSGYLVPQEYAGREIWKLAIANKEIFRLFSCEFLSALNIPAEMPYEMAEGVKFGDAVRLKKAVQGIAEKALAYAHDIKSFHKVLSAAVIASFRGDYGLLQEMKTDGDLAMLTPRYNPDYPGIVINIIKAAGKSGLQSKAKAAVAQINEKQYDMQLKAAKCRGIFKAGAAFNGKNVEIIIESDLPAQP
ncbi:MAG: ATP-binding protein [Clostridia bacterium]|nr:ATP-binding protein [Clostridia bacterium]